MQVPSWSQAAGEGRHLLASRRLPVSVCDLSISGSDPDRLLHDQLPLRKPEVLNTRDGNQQQKKRVGEKKRG